MKFVRKNINETKYVDNVFSVSSLAKKDPLAINATAGCLGKEDGKIFTFTTVFNNENNITPAQNAAYANPAGDAAYLEAISKHILEGRVKNNYDTVASAGGTGSIYLAMKTCLSEGDTVIMPDVCWGNYRVMCQEYNLNMVTYDVYNLDSLLKTIDEAKDKVFLMINSPCHNPCGQAYSLDEWKKIFDKLNNCGKEVVLVNDIAYIDYAHENAKDYFELFNHINDNVLVLVAFSCSKSFSYYGKRVGAFVAIHNDKEFLDKYINMVTRAGRSAWSNINNGAMQNIASLLNEHHDEYEKERKEAIEMLNKRTKLFSEQARACGLPFYEYKSGFFVTLKIEDNAYRDKLHQALIDNHIYTIKVNKGIRIGVCALPLNKIDGLANKINDIAKKVQ